MRFLLLAASVSILALNLAGCSCSVSTCSDVTSGMVGGDCGPTCTTCDTGCSASATVSDCGCDSCGAGSKLQRPMLLQRMKSRVTSAGAQCNDCGNSADACGCGLGSRLRGMGSRLTAKSDCGCKSGTCNHGGSSGLGMGMFEAGPECQSGTCDGGCDGTCGGGIMQGGFGQQLGSRLRGRLGGCGTGDCGLGGKLCGRCTGGIGGGNLLSRIKGCGKFGCGFGGHLCSRCKGGAGPIPHREPGAMGPGAGQVPSYAYPYYTTRAPRDFLMANPPTIGY